VILSFTSPGGLEAVRQAGEIVARAAAAASAPQTDESPMSEGDAFERFQARVAILTGRCAVARAEGMRGVRFVSTTYAAALEWAGRSERRLGATVAADLVEHRWAEILKVAEAFLVSPGLAREVAEALVS
jgi:hypothetical protein